MNSSKGGGGVGNVKNSAKDDLQKKSLPELLETLDRLKKLLSSKSIKNLPDKGAKIPGTIQEVEELIRKKEKVDPGSAGSTSLPDGGHYVDFSEWANAREKSMPIAYLYTPICKTTQEIVDRGQDGLFEGLTKKLPAAQVDENSVEMVVVEDQVVEAGNGGPKPKWDESLMPPIKESKSKEIGIKESIQLIKNNISLLKESSSSTSNTENEKNFSIHQSSTRRVNFDVDNVDNDDDMDLEVDNSLLEDIKEEIEDQISDNEYEVVDTDLDPSSNALLDRVRQMDLA